MVETLTIQTGTSLKGRSFTVSLFGMIVADRFWSGGSKVAYRPVYLSFAETDSKARAFLANLRTERPAEIRNQHGHTTGRMVECKRAAGMKWVTRKLPTGISIVTGWVPAVCNLNPGMLPERVTFVFAPPTWWVDREVMDPKIQALPEKIRREAVLGSWFAAFVDKRLCRPVVPDPLFHRRFYLAARRSEWWCEPGVKPGIGQAGALFCWPEHSLPPGLETLGAVDASHEQVEAVLQRETAAYFREERPTWMHDDEHLALPVQVAAAPIRVELEPLAATAEDVAWVGTAGPEPEHLAAAFDDFYPPGCAPDDPGADSPPPQEEVFSHQELGAGMLAEEQLAAELDEIELPANFFVQQDPILNGHSGLPLDEIEQEAAPVVHSPPPSPPPAARRAQLSLFD